MEDTQGDVKRMENARTDYRAALNWMKDVSQELDPDTNSQLDKFKNVQTKVKKSKKQFDHHKLICLQKVDLLAAARCNMFSHVLIFYQQSLQRFAESIAASFEHATKDFKRKHARAYLIIYILNIIFICIFIIIICQGTSYSITFLFHPTYHIKYQ